MISQHDDPAKSSREATAALPPLPPVPTLRVVFAWLICAFVLGSLYTLVGGFRPDLPQKIRELSFTMALALLIFSFLGFSALALLGAVPGGITAPTRWLARLAVAAAAAQALRAGLFANLGPVSEGMDFGKALECWAWMTLGALPPVVAMIFFASRLEPVNTRTFLIANIFAGSMLVSVVSNLHCPIDETMHVLVGHGVLLVAAQVIVYLVLRRYWHRINAVMIRRS